VLAKFLVHNLAVFQAKKNREQTEYEKFKRYSFTIFNSVKSRVAVADSLQLSEHSICWAQRMTKLLKRSQLNICSKYTLIINLWTVKSCCRSRKSKRMINA